MQTMTGFRGGALRASAASSSAQLDAAPARLSRPVAVGMIAVLEILIVPIMGIAAHEMLQSHQLASEAWPRGTGVVHATLILLGTIAYFVSVRLFGGYREDATDGVARSLSRMLTGGSAAAISLAALIYATTGDSWSHWSWFWTWIVTASGALIGTRIAHFVLINHLARTGTFAREVVVLGVSDVGQQILSQYFAESSQDARIVGVFDDRVERSPDYVCGYQVQGNLADLIEFARDHNVDELIVALPLGGDERMAKVLSRLREIPADVLVAAPNLQVAGETQVLDRRGGVPVIAVMTKPLTDWKLIAKECEDRILGLSILLFISPLLALIALLIKLESPGPVFFKQMRYGYKNRLIEVWKFRTMRHDLTDVNAEKLTTRNDPRVTKLGAVLRRFSLDELPQFVNVVRGEMSIVGPRPHARSAKAGGILYHDAVADYTVRHKVKPGITGLAQVSGWRGETETVEQIQRRVEHDIDYINNWSLATDLKIIALTVLTGFGGRNAY